MLYLPIFLVLSWALIFKYSQSMFESVDAKKYCEGFIVVLCWGGVCWGGEDKSIYISNSMIRKSEAVLFKLLLLFCDEHSALLMLFCDTIIITSTSDHQDLFIHINLLILLNIHASYIFSHASTCMCTHIYNALTLGISDNLVSQQPTHPPPNPPSILMCSKHD